MEDNSINIEQLIIRYLTKDANHSETSYVEKWRSESEDNFLLFREYQKIWENSGKVKAFYSVNVDNEWKKISNKIHFGEEISIAPSKRSIPYFKIAAVALVVIAAVFAGNYFLNNSDGTKQLNVEEGPKEITLADGSKITLNKNSVLEYPDNFDDDIRSVQIEGEGYFEVEKDQGKPFIVKADDINIQVLGTSFYVNTDDNNNVVVIVKEGQVEVFRDSDEEKLKVGPNEKASFSKDNQNFNKTGIEDENYLSWKTKKLVFKDKKLKKVINAINKTYDCEIIIINKENENCRWTDDFENATLDKILNLLEANFGFEVSKSGNKIELKGGGC